MANRKVFSMEEKAHILWRLEEGESNAEVAKDLGVSHSTITSIKKNRQAIENSFNEGCSTNKRARRSNHGDIEAALLAWFKQQRSNNIPINGPILQNKATAFAHMMGKDVTISMAWVQRFRKRHNIVFRKICGESQAIPKHMTDTWIENVFPEVIKGYKEDEIFNADETGLFFKLTPDRTMQFKGEKCSGGKLSKERITVMVAANMSGTVKRKLLVVGKYAKPRCFKNVKKLPVNYKNNKNSWMTKELFVTWLKEWDDELTLNKKKIILFVDNCPAHENVSLKAIKLVFLPPNTTAILQPMDQGVIKLLKTNYRKQVVLKLIHDHENNTTETKLNMLDAILMLDKAWTEVPSLAIANCFKHAKWQRNELPSNYTESSDTLVEWAENLDLVIPGITFNEFESVDNEICTSSNVTDEEIVANAIAAGTNDKAFFF